MCLKAQKDCLRGNPPLVCCALNLLIFLFLLVSGGIYIISKPVENWGISGTHPRFQELENIDFIWAEQKGKNVTELGLKPLISTDRAFLTEHHIFDLGL